jgi:tetratricopeptide (TPR) repeat protein
MYYNIDPSIGAIEGRYWAKNQVTCVELKFAEFLRLLDKKIDVSVRRLRRNFPGVSLSLYPHYRISSPEESDDLRYYLQHDAQHLHNGMIPPRQNAGEFYKGYDTGFGCILQNLDVPRLISDSLLVDAILIDDNSRRNGEFFLIKGPAGNGKTVALKRVAWEAATSYDKIALYVNGAEGIRFDPISEIHQLTGKRIYLFVDRVALFRTEIVELLKTCRDRQFPLTIIGAERENEWYIYCENIEKYCAHEFAVVYLNKEEIERLLAKLEEHSALGLLADKTHAERVDAFLNRAESQLLVALHETTLGIPFEKIVLDEFNRIPREAQLIYLQICALHQFGAPVRAGLISRASGINFEEFGKRLLKPLADVVIFEEKRDTSDDVYYRSRHQHVAELVFHQVLPSDEQKYDILAHLVTAMNVDYSSDKETFWRMVRGRSIAKLFANVELGRLFYGQAEEVATTEGFVPHQRAVFELQHPGGSLSEAEVAANRAADLNPRSRSIRHTQAEVARRQALATKDPLLKQSYRKTAQKKLAGNADQLSEYDLHTRAKVALDELRELIGRTTKIAESTAFIEAAREAEMAIQRGRTEYPQSSEILAAEADLRDLLSETPKALAALEKAFAINPRQDWLAVRLAKRYVEAGQTDRAIQVLQKCLQSNPGSKPVHLYMARLLEPKSDQESKIIDHLRRSFTPGDNNFEAQFWYARALFLAGRVSDSQAVFNSLAERAPGKFRTTSAEYATAKGRNITFDGEVTRREEGYAFIKLADFPTDIFASRSDSSRHEWDRIRPGTRVACNLAFNRKGPRATRITLRRV